MGYNITIGNAVVVPRDPDEYEGELRCDYVCEGVKRADAPAFGDPTDFTNARWPSYTAWADFCDATGLRHLLLDKEVGLMRQHPGCFQLKPEHLAQIRIALESRKALGKEPGFWDKGMIDNGKDPQLARLIWLEYWVAWALANCPNPAIENS